jgi:hypothetical protein
MIHTLPNIDNMNITSPDGTSSTGGSQEWYTDVWMKKAGCGPTVASNIVWYLTRSRSALPPLCDTGDGSREKFVWLMLDMFDYVTPGLGGVNTSAIFADGLARYGTDHGVTLTTRVLELPAWPCKRPELPAVTDFIQTALQSDAPVAFLNLSNGTLTNLESWHWVTILSLDPNTATATICDQGDTLDIDLGEWLRTSKLGGAMVYIELQTKEN